jgi:hypothetical protein
VPLATGIGLCCPRVHLRVHLRVRVALGVCSVLVAVCNLRRRLLEHSIDRNTFVCVWGVVTRWQPAAGWNVSSIDVHVVDRASERDERERAIEREEATEEKEQERRDDSERASERASERG